MAEETSTTEENDANQVLSEGAVSDVRSTGGDEERSDSPTQLDTQSGDAGTANQSAPSIATGLERSAGPSPAADVLQPDVVDIDAELSAKESLADRLEKSEITYEQYAKSVAKHDRRITQAQRQMAEPARRVERAYQQQEQAKAYWTKWGSGKDVAQMQYGKSVTPSRAKAVYTQVEAEFDANPRYQRREFQESRAALIYDKFVDALAVEATKKPGTTTRAPVQTRASGASGAAGGSAAGGNKTARQRLNEGEYDLSGDAQRLGMV